MGFWEPLAGRRNGFNLIRLVLASAVLVSHSWPLSGAGPDPSAGGMTLGTWAVGGFFGLSGFLVTTSRLRVGTVGFLWRRAVRVFPAFWVSLLLVALVWAPISVLYAGVWIKRDSLDFVLGNLALTWHGHPFVHNTLGSVPAGKLWNGSLWTLPYEFAAYLVLAVLLATRWARRHRVPVLVSAMVAAYLLPDVEMAGAPTPGAWSPPLLARSFAAGALLSVVITRVRRPHLVAAGCGLVIVAAVVTHQARLLAPMPVAYLVVWAAALLPQGSLAGVDLSYGTYVHAWPVQQVLASAGVSSAWLMLLLAAPVVAVISAASWFLVERPALGAKAALDPPYRLLRRIRLGRQPDS